MSSLEEDSEEILSVALLSPACLIYLSIFVVVDVIDYFV
jgi:hypothetical protein